MTQAIFIETAKAEALAEKDKRRRLNVSGVLRILGVSRTGYYSFKNRKPSNRQIHKEMLLVGTFNGLVIKLQANLMKGGQ